MFWLDFNPVSFNSVDLKYLRDEDLEPEQLDQVRKLEQLNKAADADREPVMEQPVIRII